MEEVRLMKGNEALAHAAIRYGADGYFGYPITPQTEIGEYLSDEMYKRGNRYNSHRAFNLWLSLSDYFCRKENKIVKINLLRFIDFIAMHRL